MANLRQRKKPANDKQPEQKKTNNNPKKDKTDKQKTKGPSAPPPRRQKKKLTGKQIIPYLFAFVSIVSLILFYFYATYGPTIILGHAYRDYKLTPYQWRRMLDGDADDANANAKKTILIIGGPHRSGTTIVWKALAAHPEIAGFGDTFETGADFSEGILFQDVYPKFGVGMEFKYNFGNPNSNADEPKNTITDGGLGKYALLPEEHVHWTKESKKDLLQDPTIMSKLLNRFGPYWDKHNGLDKSKVWVEKSPQNAVLSLFLEGVYNMPILEDGSVKVESKKKSKSKPNATKFMFMTRHPVANVYATKKLVHSAMGGFIVFETILKNYIQIHKYMTTDQKELDSPVMWVKLEDFTSDPSKSLKSMFSFLDVSHKIDGEAATKHVLENIDEIKSDPNAKYFKEWCEEDEEMRSNLISEYNEEIKSLKLGYDLDGICS